MRASIKNIHMANREANIPNIQAIAIWFINRLSAWNVSKTIYWKIPVHFGASSKTDTMQKTTFSEEKRFAHTNKAKKKYL